MVTKQDLQVQWHWQYPDGTAFGFDTFKCYATTGCSVGGTYVTFQWDTDCPPSGTYTLFASTVGAADGRSNTATFSFYANFG